MFSHEKEGIPVELIQHLDVCVEVPQEGIIRSMNVHVTGASKILIFVFINFFSSCYKYFCCLCLCSLYLGICPSTNGIVPRALNSVISWIASEFVLKRIWSSPDMTSPYQIFEFPQIFSIIISGKTLLV